MENFWTGSEFLPLLLKGAGITARISLLALLLAIVIAFVVGLARRSQWKLVRAVAVVYVEFFRGTSVLVQLFFLYYILPLYGIRLPAEATGIVGLGLNLGAYGSEIVRSAIGSIGKGQIEAAQSLSLPSLVTFFKIVMPQALILMLPSFGNLAIEIVKATSLVSLITIPELTFMGHSLVSSTGDTVQVWLYILLIYLALNAPLNVLVAWAERRSGRFREGSRGV